MSEPTAIVKARDAKKERLIVKGAERRDRGRLGVDPAEQHSHPENLPAKKTGGLKRSLNAAERTLSVLRGEKGEKEYERSARRGGESDEEDEEDEENEEEEEPEPSDSSNHHHVVTWALSFIQARLKAQRNSPWTEDTTKAFAPLLPLLNICLSQRHSGPAMMTLKVYVALLGVPHFTTLQQSGSVSSVTRSTFKLLKVFWLPLHTTLFLPLNPSSRAERPRRSVSSACVCSVRSFATTAPTRSSVRASSGSSWII